MRKVRFGVVGLGRLGRKHAENIRFRIANSELLAVCSVKEEELKDVRENWEIPYGYTDYDEMLKNKELEAIFISSPSCFHCEQVEKALDAGFHVFCEKPLGLDVEETKRVARVVAAHPEQLFMLGFMRRYDKSYADAKEKIVRGAIGKPYLIRCYGLDPAQSIRGFLQFAKNNSSGGIFMDMAIHDLDLARWYLGSEAETVWAIGGAYKYPEISELNDAETAAAMIQFENGSMGLFVAGRSCAHGYHIETEIIGTEGSLRIGALPEKNLVTIFDEKGVSKECVGGFLERFEQAYLDETVEFINCILENRKPEVTVRDGVLATELAYACKQSLETGRLVKVGQEIG